MVTITEKNIVRAAQALSLGIEDTRVAEILMSEGATPEVAYLLITAGKLFAKFANGKSKHN